MRRIIIPLAAALFAATALAAAAPDARRPAPRRVTPAQIRVDAVIVTPGAHGVQSRTAAGFVARHGGQWQFAFDRRSDRPTLIQGSGIPLVPGRGNQLDSAGRITLETLEPKVRELLLANATLLMPAEGRLELDRDSSQVREDGRLASLLFRWTVGGVPVERAHVFVRLNSGNVTQLGAPLVADLTADPTPSLDAQQAIESLMDYSGDAELYRLQGEPRLVFQPEDGITRIDYRLVWKVTYRVLGRIETWQGRIDARSGEVVGLVDINAYGRVRGGVFPRTGFDQNELSVPFPAVELTIDGASVISDTAGSFPYAGGAASTGLDGQWFETDCQECIDPPQAWVQFDLGAGHVDFGSGGLDEFGNGFSTRADRNTFYHLNQVRRVALKWLPDLPWLGTRVISVTNINRACNAFYDGAVNFFRASGVCRNTGEIADIITHEWGHGIDEFTLLGDPATGEGTADVTALHLSHSPIIGPGYRFTGDAVRNIDPNGPRGLLTTTNIGNECTESGFVGPLGYEVHCEGEIYGQTAWELSQALVARYGYHTGWRTSERLFFTSLPDAGGYLSTDASPIYAAYLNADDDDGDLANGTPNAAEIFAAFERHGIAGSAVTGSAPCTPPAQPVVSVLPVCEGFELSWDAVTGAEQYQIFRGELRLEQALFPVATVASDQTGFTDAEVASAMDYWYVVMAVDSTGCESTIENPVAVRLPAQSILSIVAAAADDTPRGNRSGFADPDEEVDLVVDLRNLGSADAVTIRGTITTTTAGVEVLDGSADWPGLAPGEVGANLDSLRFRANSPDNVCGGTLTFEFVPDATSGCASDSSFFTVELGDAGVCDDTPACFAQPTFGGLDGVTQGGCGETQLAWLPGQTNCENATLGYNVYRGTQSGFVPSAANRIASGVSGTTFHDSLLAPDQTYYYIVRADDSRSGEDGNLLERTIVAPGLPDLSAPLFSGLSMAATGAACGDVQLGWTIGLESCSPPVSYEIYRGTTPDFAPDASNRIGSSLSAAFVDVAPGRGVEYTYVVRARDSAGNEDLNEARLTVSSGATDLVIHETDFETTDDGWRRSNQDDVSTGWWEWGTPDLTTYQPGACASGSGCWVTGLDEFFSAGGNNDVDDGSTTLESRALDLSGAIDPVVRYALWFTNDQGASPGEDPLRIDASDDGGNTWYPMETVGAGTPLAWVERQVDYPQQATAGNNVRFRLVASDLGAGSMVEAALDDFAVLDRGQGCSVCPLPVAHVGAITVDRGGADVILDWTDDPVIGDRFAVYVLSGSGFSDAVRVGTTDSRSFVHLGATTAPGLFAYRVAALDSCGNESNLD